MHIRPVKLRELAAFLAFIVAFGSPGYVLAKKEPKAYPEEGKILSTGLTEWVINRQHQYAHTYTVATSAKTYLLECGHKPLFGSMGEECGGTKKLQVGDVIHFRIENERAYIPITKVDNSSGEEKLRILSTTLRSDAGADKP